MSSQSLYTALQDLSGARFTEINHPRDVVDFDFLRLAREKGIALPSGRETKRDKFHGGFVLDAKPGRHENVLYTDLAALYPNIMRAMNMSPETLVGTREELESSSYTEDDCVWSYVDMREVKRLSEDEMYSDFTDGQYKIVHDPNSGTIKWRDDWGSIQDHIERLYFVAPEIQEGFIASRADDYIKWNKSYSGTMYKATKAQRNTLYGVNGDPNFRLFEWRVAEAVCLAGRLILTHSIDAIQEYITENSTIDETYACIGDSVPEYEPVTIRHENGDVDVVEIQDLHGFDREVDVWTEDGWTRIKKVIQKPNRKQMYRVRTKHGVVHVTEDHSLLRDDGKEVAPEEVDIGDSLLHRHPEVVGSESDIDKDLAWLLGAFVADGSCGTYESTTGTKRPWALSKRDTDFLERAASILESDFDVDTSIRDYRESSGCYKLKVNNFTYGDRIGFIDWWRNQCYAGKRKTVPNGVINGSKNVRRAFVAGYNDGDGHDERGAIDDIGTMEFRDATFATEMSILLQNLGYEVTIDVRDNHGKEYYRIRTVSYHRGNPSGVESIEKVDYDGEYVYDLETENHHFHAGVGNTIVHNTDGFGLTIPGAATRGTAFDVAEEAVEWINSEGYSEYMTETFGTGDDAHYMEIEIESYSPALFVPQTSKGDGVGKTYAKWTTIDEGEEVDEVDITGFECERSDIADITEEVQRHILEIILRNDVGTAKERIYPYLRDLHERFDSGDIPLADIGKRSGMSKHCYEYGTPNRRAHPVFRGAKYAHDHIDGENFESGGKPYEFRVSDIGCSDHPSQFKCDTAETDGHSSVEECADCSGHYGAEQGDDVDVISVEEIRNIPDCATIDYDAHWTKTVEQPVRQILYGMGVEWEDVYHGHEQSDFSRFEK